MVDTLSPFAVLVHLPTSLKMVTILLSLLSTCYLLTFFCTPTPSRVLKKTAGYRIPNLPLLLPHSTLEPSKYTFEVYSFKYSIIWMSIFCLIVLTEVYESFTHPLSYLLVCGTLSLPYLLYPFFTSSPYASKAILYLTIYSFIGNYFYTHYFYTVLKAQYTFIGVRFNNVPIGESTVHK